MLLSIYCVISQYQYGIYLTISVLHLSQNIVNLYGCYLNEFKFFIMVDYTNFQARVTNVTLKIALNIQVNVSNKPC